MMASVARRARWPALAVGLAGLLLCWYRPSGAQVRASQQGKPAVEEKTVTRQFYDLFACLGCHDNEKDYLYVDNPARPPFTACSEIRKREPVDKHVIAYEVLSGTRAQRMGVLLKHKIPDITAAKECLSCHSVWLDPLASPPADRGNLKHQEGVSCVACHGPDVPRNKTDPGWSLIHATRNTKQRDFWRGLPRAQKEADFGMIDLWDPVRRARLCASCHIGNLAENKVVTHEMYAAGHPPLPGFEVATFSDQMPRHWQSLREKYLDPERRDLLKNVLHLSEVDADLEEINLLAAGSLVALEASMELMAGQARSAWPELAQFDCYACHHELKAKSWRKDRGYAGKPGRVPMRPWVSVLVELGIVHASVDDVRAVAAGREFQAAWHPLQDALDRQPFGEPGQVADSADKIAKWATGQLQSLGENLGKGKYTSASARRLLDRLLELQKRQIPDYDSARQIGWALEVLTRNTSTSKAAAPWQSLDAYLKLTLPHDRIPIKPTADLTRLKSMPWLKFQPAPLENALPDALERINAYEPMEFRVRLAAVVESIK